VYYNNANNEFLIKSNNKTIPLLKEKSRINEKEWLQDKEETIKHNIFLHELLLSDKHWNPNYELNVIDFLYKCYNIDFPEYLLDKKYVRKTLASTNIQINEETEPTEIKPEPKSN
jgi:hypothetical protein